MNRLVGILLILASGMAFGAMTALAPVAYGAGTSPSTLLFLRFAISGLALAAYMGVLRLGFPKGRILLVLMLMGGVWYFCQSLAFFTALSMASASLAALLLYLYPAVVALISAVVLREPLTRRRLLALALALAGTFLTIGPDGGGETLGILLALGAAFLYAGYIIVGDKVMKQAAAIPATTVVMLAAALSFGGLVAAQGIQLPDRGVGWLAVLGIAACCIIALGGFFAGLKRVGPANTAILSTVEPLVAVVLAAILLNERLAPVQLVGGLCILIAVVFLARDEFARTG
jgi:drug/metabolite transporter (DMT)-like permease